MPSSTSASTFVPSDSARPSFRQKLVRQSRTALEEASAAALAGVRAMPGAALRRGTALLQRLAGAEPARALALVGKARRLRPGSPFLAQGAAILTARARGWQAAGPLFADPAALAKPGAARGLLRGRPAPPACLALPARERPADLDPETAAGIVVYTTAFGAEPDPAPVLVGIAGLRFVCLTDRPLDAAGWEAILPPRGTPARAAAWCRIRPDLALAEAAPAAAASLYLRSDRWLVGNLHTLLMRWCMGHDLALWRHPAGIDWQDLAEARLIAAPSVPAAVIAQARDCEARALPRDRGAWDAGMIWRRHTAPVADLMAAWWAEAEAAPDGIEETALYAALNGPAAAACRPRLLPAALGAADDNAFVAARPPAPRPPAPRPPAPLPRGNAPRRGAWPVAVVYAEAYAASASTFLRGRQLAELVAERDEDLADMAYTSDLAGLGDRVVVLTKGALKVHSPETIAALGRRNIAVVGSWDDMLPEADKVAATSASMTLSHRQTVDFARAFPERPAFHVTHHVNRQIRPSQPPMDRPRTGYFGYLRNTHCPESLRGMIDLVGLSTATVEMGWLELLPGYNAHWIVRRRGKAHDGWKPFLKGFVAARCNAVVITGRDDDDAMQYLGDDYPFYVGGTDAATLEMDMMRIAAAFGGPDWARAQAIMAQVGARASDEVVVAEFRAMVRALAA